MYPHAKLPPLLGPDAISTDVDMDLEPPVAMHTPVAPDALAVPGLAVTPADLALAVGHYADDDAIDIDDDAAVAATSDTSAADPLNVPWNPTPGVMPTFHPGSGFGTSKSKPARRGKYGPGKHGSKKTEQTRLTAGHGQKVSGATHESEHPVGDAVLRETTGLLRTGKGRARELEMHAPAYQESHQMHRNHIGTGSSSEADESGMNAKQYRTTQRNMLELGDISSAVQVNQLAYATMPGFQQETGFRATSANDSYTNMVTNLSSLTYGQGDQDVSKPVSQMQQVEMLVARDAARTGKWPERDALKQAWEKLGYVQPADEVEDDDAELAAPVAKKPKQ